MNGGLLGSKDLCSALGDLTKAGWPSGTSSPVEQRRWHPPPPVMNQLGPLLALAWRRMRGGNLTMTGRLQVIICSKGTLLSTQSLCLQFPSYRSRIFTFAGVLLKYPIRLIQNSYNSRELYPFRLQITNLIKTGLYS